MQNELASQFACHESNKTGHQDFIFVLAPRFFTYCSILHRIVTQHIPDFNFSAYAE